MSEQNEQQGIEWLLLAPTQDDGNGGWFATEMNTKNGQVRQLHYRRSSGEIVVDIVSMPPRRTKRSSA